MKNVTLVLSVLVPLLCSGCKEERTLPGASDPLHAALELHLSEFPDSRGKYFEVEWTENPPYSDPEIVFEQLGLELISEQEAGGMQEEYIRVKVRKENGGYWKKLAFEFVEDGALTFEQIIRLEREGAKWWAEDDSLIWTTNCEF